MDPLVIDRQMDRYRSGKRRLEALCRTYGVALAGAHDAGSDADATVGIVRAMAVKRIRDRHLRGRGADRLEAEWHRTWAIEYDAWCRDNGRPWPRPRGILVGRYGQVLDPNLAA